jgi:hypothetical protein
MLATTVLDQQTINRTLVKQWVREWIDLWNRRDLEALLARCRDDVRFESPLAKLVTGSSLIEGKAALRSYWAIAMGQVRVQSLELDRVIWDPLTRELAVGYSGEVDGHRLRSCVIWTLDTAWQVVRGDASYGATISVEQKESAA